MRLVLAFLFLFCGAGYAWDGKSFKKPSEMDLKKKLNSLQFNVTQHEDTEPPFKNIYWNHKAEGIYVDIVSGEPLFSSANKYDSGTGWPSFTKPLVKENIVTKEDRSLGSVRVEVRSKYGDSHLGHVFDDGPPPTGLRYCMNSAAMKFIPAADLKKMGYGEYSALFDKSGDKSSSAVFAGGCFWSMEKAFESLKDKGVLKVVSGFSGGHVKNPSYEQVSGGKTGHLEAVEVTYDPKKVSYGDLLKLYWSSIDPMDGNGQFCDEGEEYESAIFVGSKEERVEAEKSLADINQKLKGKPMPSGVFEKATPDNMVKTKILDRVAFYPAEDYHQDFYLKNPARYNSYRVGCGRDARLKAIWGATGLPH